VSSISHTQNIVSAVVKYSDLCTLYSVHTTLVKYNDVLLSVCRCHFGAKMLLRSSALRISHSSKILRVVYPQGQSIPGNNGNNSATSVMSLSGISDDLTTCLATGGVRQFQTGS
jgi:hypothetical protein